MLEEKAFISTRADGDSMGILILTIAGWIAVSLISTPLIGRFLVAPDDELEAGRSRKAAELGSSHGDWLGTPGGRGQPRQV